MSPSIENPRLGTTGKAVTLMSALMLSLSHFPPLLLGSPAN